MINFDPSRIHQALLNTGLQNKDNPLYQVLKQIIDALKQAASGVNSNISQINVISSTPPPVVVTPTIDTYAVPVTNGDPINPELLFDSFGEVVMLTGIPL